MPKNKFKQKNMAVPIENHKTAAWSDIKDLKRESKVFVPSELEVRNAKEWVDTNQK
ncbi:MAG: CDIF630_02480 family spore surface protein [Natronincolaceae bacterium]|jgi:hypothetical protein|nr:DUF3787 domain-containing protein [Bacillota bacterium]NLK90287.1 DUF3787 domain-containing protein [Clostridiales bacterium]